MTIQTVELETNRLRLRQWQKEDYDRFAQLNADPVVMEYFPALLSRKESDELADKLRTQIAERGWGLWVLEEKHSNQFAGFVGLHEPDIALPFSPSVEIGWRLDKAYWGKGYATEAASKVLEYAFGVLKLAKIVSYTATTNLRSKAVMVRLGMVDTKQNFEHPKVPVGHVLRQHVLYEIEYSKWNNQK